MNNGFQNEAAGYLWRKYGAEISELYILFPSRRARLFFNDALAAVATEPVWQPHWMTTDELVAEITGLHTADKVRLITELYKVYAEYHPHETFDKFYFWGEMLLADFDMIDKYMIDAGMLLRNIEQIKELEADVSYLTPEQQRIIAFWGSFGDETSLTEEKRKFLNIWRTLPDIYRRFRERIASLGMAYQGMAYRTAAEMIAAGEACADPSRRYVVAGYNALSQSEKRIFKHIAANSPGTEFLWDYDSWYTDRKEHEAGMFIRENLSLFPPTADISHDSLLRGDKRFESIACASNAIQCKYVADILRSLPPEQLDKRTAIVLTDENLLLPLLYSLPEGLEGINVTMGYPLRQTLVYTFIERRFIGACNRVQRYDFKDERATFSDEKNDILPQNASASRFFRRFCNSLLRPQPAEMRLRTSAGRSPACRSQSPVAPPASRRLRPAAESFRAVLHRAVGAHAVETLVGRGRRKRPEGFDPRTQLDVVERLRRHARRKLRPARIPPHAQLRHRPPHDAGHPRHFGGFAVAAHEADARHRPAVAAEQHPQCIIVQRLAAGALQMGAMAAGAAVGTPRKVDGQRRFAGNLSEDHVEIVKPQHGGYSALA